MRLELVHEAYRLRWETGKKGTEKQLRELTVQMARDLPGSGRLRLERGTPPRRIETTPRLGVRRAADRPWRFVDPGSPALSRR